MKSPGMKALEALIDGYFMDRMMIASMDKAASIIELETGVTALQAENKRLRSAANDAENYHSIACQELENSNGAIREVRQQADALATALEVANGALISAAHYGGMFGSQLGDKYREASNVVRAALTAYNKLKAKSTS